MSLRAKLIAAIVFVNLLVLGGLFYFFQHANQRVLTEAADRFRAAFTKEVLRSFAALVPERVTIEPILDFKGFDALCRDVIILNNPNLSEPSRREPLIQVNPLGAYGRDPATFPRAEIIAGIKAAMDRREALPVYGGYCMPIETAGGRVLGGGWFVPQWAVEPSFPSGRIMFVIGLGVLVLAGFTYVGMERWALGPLDELSEAARALERGELGKQVDVGAGAREIRRVAGILNRASRQLEEHQAELAQAVEEATERARRRERELVLSQRLAALGTLAAGIAHEINNPLGGMMNAVNRIKKRGGDGVSVELLEEGLARIRDIVRRTLDFAPRSSEPVRFRIDAAIERARALVAHRMQNAGVRFVYQGTEDDVVNGDPHELSQVFLNLFLNSLDALEEGLSADAELRVRVTTGDDEAGQPVVAVEIADNGPGVDPETLDRIFDPFFSTKGVTSTSDKIASGLGMSISFSIVEQHGGTMRATTPPGGGFVVSIILPREHRPGRAEP